MAVTDCLLPEHGLAKDIQCDFLFVTPPGMPNVCALGRYGGQVTPGMCKHCLANNLNRVGGPGTELKRLLAGFPLYIKTTPSCPCNKRAQLMDDRGCQWCEENMPTIVGWLQEEHASRKMLVPFSEVAVTQLINLAIRRAKKKGNSQ